MSKRTDLWGQIEQAAERWPDQLMLVSRQGDAATFAEYHQRCLAMASGLSDLGIGPGDVVSWILPTWVDTVVLAGALSRLGAVQNPIIGIYRDKEVGFCTKQCSANFLLTPGEFGGYDFAALGQRVAEANGLRHIVVEPGSFPVGQSAVPAVPAPTRNDVRWICYTSGTTADPKGAKHADQTVGSFPDAMGERLDVAAGDRYALVFPFPHIGGIGLLFMAVQRGCTHLLDAVVDPVATIEFLSEQDCTHAGTGTPFFLMYLAMQAKRTEAGEGPLFPNLKVTPGGGAPIAPALHHRLKTELGGKGAASGWGLTEAPELTNLDVNDPDDKIATTEGRALPGVELIVVPVGSDEPASRGVEGELRAKGPMVMLGYVDASLDADAFDADGYYRTGDLGTIDADGFVTITGRLKDVIIRNGENISAQEVENLMFGLAEVADVAVIGLADDRTGESVCAVIVPAEGATPTVASVHEALVEAGLRKQATPSRLEVVDSLPRSPAGKVTKGDLVDRFG